MDQDGFDKMNYRDLQKLAKTAGVKANLPKAELIKALQENAANDSCEDSYQESAPSKTEPSVCDNKNVSKDVINTTFEVEDTPEESNKLNRTFDKLTPEPERRKSTRLSVETLTTSSRFVEIMNSPKPRNSSSGPTKLSVPSRPGASVEKNTPKVSSARKPTGRKSMSTPGASRKVSTPSTLKSVRKDSGKKIAMATNIPRFVKFARKVPDFAKMHEREFKKMESLDTYLDKKKKRTEMTRVQMHKAKTLAEEHSKIMNKMKSRTPVSKFVPVVTSTSKMNLNFGSSTPGAKAPFKFSAATAVVSSKKPERAQVGVKTATKPKVTSKVTERKPIITPAKQPQTPVSKPLHNITNKSVGETPSSARKGFDLKASLAKPLGYKPHLGKLPTWGDKKVRKLKYYLIFNLCQVKKPQLVSKIQELVKYLISTSYNARFKKSAIFFSQNPHL